MATTPRIDAEMTIWRWEQVAAKERERGDEAGAGLARRMVDELRAALAEVLPEAN